LFLAAVSVFNSHGGTSLGCAMLWNTLWYAVTVLFMLALVAVIVVAS